MSSSNHDVNLILKARDEASAKLNRLSGTIKGLALGVAGYFSARAIGGFLKSSVAAFAESEQAAKGLSDALQSMGQSGNIAALDEYAKQMQKLTTYEDDAVIASMKLGVTIGGLSGRDLTAATTAAIGLSKAFNMDLNAAMTLVSKAASGNFVAFSRMGITFKEGSTDAEKYAAVLERGAQGFRIAQGETDTFTGVLAQLKNAWGDAKEGVGQYISESSRLKGVFGAVTFGLTNLVDVSKWAWANMELHIQKFRSSLEGKASVPLGVHLGNMWAAIVSPEFRKMGTTEEQDKADIEYFRGQVAGKFNIPFLQENSDKMAGVLGKKWADYSSGQFDFNAAAAVTGAGMGRGGKGDAMRGGGSITLESRTARWGGGGVNPIEQKLDRQIKLMERLVTVTEQGAGRTFQKPINYFGPSILETAFQ